jgi:hypothetical protein
MAAPLPKLSFQFFSAIAEIAGSVISDHGYTRITDGEGGWSFHDHCGGPGREREASGEIIVDP